MNWLSVMTLPDGTTVDMPMPTSEDTVPQQVHQYRVRGNDGIIEFASLPQVVDYLLNRGDRTTRTR